MINRLLPALLLIACSTYLNSLYGSTLNEASSSIPEQGVGDSDTIISRAFTNRETDLQVYGQGIVTRLLPDDNNGSRHQRFIIRLSSGQTLLVTHNIDLAPRINVLGIGDTVEFYGEYEWNEKGGVIHWTHHDPDGSHVGGWLHHDGKRYQ